MIRKTLLSTLIVGTALVLSQCNKDDSSENTTTADVTFNVVMTDGENQVYDGETVSLQNGYDLKISLFRMFLSGIEIKNSAGNWVMLKDVVIVDPGSTQITDRQFTANVNVGNYTALRYGLGLDATMNNSDPSTFNQNHPLSTYQAMYWTMLKYRFAKFEGLANVTGQLGSSSDILVAFHPGTDDLYRTDEVLINNNVQAGQSNTISLELDLNALFAGTNAFDFSTESSTHSMPSDIALAAKFMDKLKVSLSVE